MTATQLFLLFFICLFLGYSIYYEFIMPKRHGATLLSVRLKNRSWLDGLIFIGLSVILFYQYVLKQGDNFTGLLLAFLIISSCYVYFIRQPKLLLKEQGFFYAGFFIAYQRVSAINFAPNNSLVLTLERKNLVIHVENAHDLQKIYQALMQSKSLPEC